MALCDQRVMLCLPPPCTRVMIEGYVVSYFASHIDRQLHYLDFLWFVYHVSQYEDWSQSCFFCCAIEGWVTMVVVGGWDHW